MLVFHRVIVMFWAAVAALLALGLVFSASASADIAVPDDSVPVETVDAALDCDFVLTDQGETLGDATPIVVAAEDLERFGDVRIRVFDQTPTGSLDEALSDIANSCDWLDPDGNYPADFFLFGVSVEDRATRVLYGADWAPALDDSASVIIDRIINAQFAEGNYQGGLLGGIEQFASLRADADGVSLDEDADGVSLDEDDVEVIEGLAPESTEESGSEEPSDAQDESTPLTVETFPEVPGDSAEPADQAGEAAPEVMVESQDSNTGFYALIAGVLVAITVLPALVLRRSRDSDAGDSAA